MNKNFFTPTILLLSGSFSLAAVSIGDIAVIGMSGDTAPGGGGSGKSFTFVATTTIAGNEVINFTDSGWEGSNLRASEGGATYTVPALGLPAGTVVTATGTSNETWANNGPEWTAPPSDVGNNGMNFSTSGDQVLVFQGGGSSPTFISAMNGASTGFSDPANASDSNRTALPPTLIIGSSAVAVGSGPGDEDEFDNVYYTGPTTFNSEADLRTAVFDSTNWTGSNTDYAPVTTDFTIVPEPSTALLSGLALLGLLRRRR